MTSDRQTKAQDAAALLYGTLALVLTGAAGCGDPSTAAPSATGEKTATATATATMAMATVTATATATATASETASADGTATGSASGSVATSASASVKKPIGGRIPPRMPTPGRPFLVHGSARVAPSAACSGWGDAIDLELGSLPVHERELLARHYTEMGLAEHASVAAFARFALQLLAVGAPSSLVQQATEAMADETRHARFAFGVASAFAGEAVGPGALPLAGALDEVCDLEQLVGATLREGVLGETLASLELSAAAEVTRDPSLRAALLRIAAEEARHAELALRVVAWAVHHEPSLCELVRKEVARHAQGESSVVTGSRDVAIEAWGVLSPGELEAVRRLGFEQVVRPLCAQLGAGATRAPAPSAHAGA